MRSLPREIRLIPEHGGPVIELVWELAGILAVGEESKRPHGASVRARQLTLVAGASPYRGLISISPMVLEIIHR